VRALEWRIGFGLGFAERGPLTDVERTHTDGEPWLRFGVRDGRPFEEGVRPGSA